MSPWVAYTRLMQEYKYKERKLKWAEKFGIWLMLLLAFALGVWVGSL